MGRSKNLKLFIVIMAVLSLTLSGCKEKTKTDVAKDQKEQAGNENVIEDGNENPEAGEEELNEKPAEKENVSVSECLKIYQKFLSGSQKVHFDMCDLANEDNRYAGPGWDLETIANRLQPGKEYSIKEFSEGLCQGHAEYFDQKLSLPKSISYSYIDCGKDEIPELAMLFEEVGGENLADSFIVIFKVIDDKLQCIFNCRYGYRANAVLGEYGMVTYGGSNGAASYTYMVSYVGDKGDTTFLYGIDDALSAVGLYIPGNTEYLDVAEEEGIIDRIEIEQYYFRLCDEKENYEDYIKNCDYVYYPLSENGNRLSKEGLEEALSSGSYQRFWDSTQLNAFTEEQMQEKIDAVYEKAGITKDILNGVDVQWMELGEETVNDILGWKTEYEAKTIELPAPSWEYYCKNSDAASDSLITLYELQKTPNQVTDESEWFNSIGMTQPDRLEFKDYFYQYRLYGETDDGLKWYPYLMDITKIDSEDKEYTLDFSNYYTPDGINPGDEAYVDESIHWAVYDEGVLYVSTFHNTYAHSAPHNGYITAFDVNNNFEVLWRSEPLTINSNNFIVADDSVICGYGFTAEEDYVYVLDKHTGERNATYPVKSSPEWFVIKDNMLYVRCYDTDYVYDIYD